jgi:hypothetical protein
VAALRPPAVRAHRPQARPETKDPSTAYLGVMRLHSIPALLGLLLLGAGLSPVPAAGNAAAHLPAPRIVSDTLGDPLEALLGRAREARTRSAEGLESFEGVLREWIQLDLTSPRFRRSRALFAQERMGRIRWHREETQIVQWEGAARALPLGEGTVSVRTDGQADDEIDAATGEISGLSNAEDLARDLLRSGAPAPLFFDQGTDRLLFGPSDWALHPLADTASLHYRYTLGDTIRLTLPERATPLELVEVRIEPKERSFRLISGILWIEPESGFLVRAAYRPSRPFNLGADLEGGPRFGIPSIEFEIRTVAVDHALFDFTWWVPWRYRFEGELRLGSLIRFPVSFEWSVTDLDVNEAPSAALQAGAMGEEGWTVRVREREGRPPLEIRVAPPSTLAQGATTLDGERIARMQGTGAFTPAEMARLEAQIRALVPAPATLSPEFRWGLSDGLTRFNRVEGISAGIQARMGLPRDRGLAATVRAGHADRTVRGELAAHWGPSNRQGSVALYRRLDPSSDWGSSHGLGNSISTLLLRNRWTPFHASQGAEIRFDRTGLQANTTLRLFGERQRAVVHSTDLHLWPWGDRPEAPMNHMADPGTWWGGSLFVQAAPRLRWPGLDVATRGRLEAAGGTSRYARGWGSASARLSLPGPFQLGLESGGGALSKDTPTQRHFLPGDVEIFRGIRPGEVVAERFTFRRAELGAVQPPVGLIAFVDELHVRSPESSGWSPRQHSAGFGFSLADGILRADIARPIGTGSPERWQDGWRFFLYLDGLF